MGFKIGAGAREMVSRRRETPRDASFRLLLFKETYGGVLAGLDGALAEQLLAQQMAGQEMTYRARYPDAHFDIVEADGLPIGRMIVDHGADVWTLVDIALRAAHRGRGLGTALLRGVLREACECRVPVCLSVAPESPARRLYARLGFGPVGENDTHVAMRWG